MPIWMQPVRVLCNPHRRDWDLETKHLSISALRESQLWDLYESEIGGFEALYMDEVIAGGEMKSLFMPLRPSLFHYASLSLLSFFISASLFLCVSNFSVLMRGDIMNADAVREALKGKVTRTLAHKRTHTHTFPCSYGSNWTTANTGKIIRGGWNDRQLTSWYEHV